MSLLIERIRPGRPTKNETKASRTHCRVGHELTEKNSWVKCRPCHNERARRTFHKMDARKNGLPLPEYDAIVCGHDLALDCNKLIQCRACDNIVRTAGNRRRNQKSSPK